MVFESRFPVDSIQEVKMKLLVFFPLLFGTAAAADWVLMDSLKMGSNFRDYEGRKVRGARMSVYCSDRE